MRQASQRRIHKLLRLQGEYLEISYVSYIQVFPKPLCGLSRIPELVKMVKRADFESSTALRTALSPASSERMRWPWPLLASAQTALHPQVPGDRILALRPVKSRSLSRNFWRFGLFA